MKTFIINLKDSTDRRDRVLDELSKYPFLKPELVEAVDGRKMSQKEIAEQFDCQLFASYMGYDVLSGEIGCTLSHRECYRRLLDSEEDVALVLEDDVRFLDDVRMVEKIISEVIVRMPSTPCVLTFSRHSYYYSKKEYMVDKYSFYRVHHALGTCAYLINKGAARRLLQIQKPYFVADDYRLMNKMNIWVGGIHPILAIGASEISQQPTAICNDWEVINDEKMSSTVCNDYTVIPKKRSLYFYLRYLLVSKIYTHILLNIKVLSVRKYGGFMR